MRYVFSILVLALAFGASSFAQTPVDVQPVKKLVPTGTLGTCSYKPVEKESQFYTKLSETDRVTGSSFDSNPFTIHGKNGREVSWFGIVRGISRGPEGSGKMTLLMEQKYFDGLTDCHIMLVARAGGGDFLAEMTGDPEDIRPLSLMRIYGEIIEEKDGTPKIQVEYARVWPWLTFTFTDLGPEDKGNPRWRKYCKLCSGGSTYKPYPDERYYSAMLGDPSEFGLHLKDLPK
jgi:hypothetical protein